MRTFARRRLYHSLRLAVLLGLGGAAYGVYRVSQARPEFLSGWVLIAVVLVLAVYGVRKRLSMLNLSPAASWLQLHIYLGIGALVLFTVHVGLRWPDGVLESLLFGAFVVTAGSGVLGLYLSRRQPRRLTRRGEEVIYERIPRFVAQLREQAEALVTGVAARTGSSTLPDFYRDELAHYFEASRYSWPHLFGSGRPIFMLTQRLNALRRYLGADEREAHEQLLELVEQKNDLDFHYAVQSALKWWVFIHVPATVSMLLLAFTHILVVYAFTA